MTPAEILKRECEEITQRTGIYILPYRLANLMKTAQKVTELITKSDCCVSYHESMLILRIVMNAVREVTGEEKE